MSRSKTNLDISVVIVSFNTKELLRKCLISIKEQFCGVSYEIIVVDNDSKDGSVEMLEEEFPSVSLIKNNYNAGISRGNNQGIKASRSDYILLANPDLEIVSDNVGDLLDYMEANPKVGMLGPKIFLPNGDIQTSATSFPTLFTVLAHHLGLKKLLPSDSARKLAIQSFGKVLGNPTCKYLRVYREAADPEIVDWVTSALLLIRKEVFSDIGYWDEDFFLYADEVDFQLRANKAGWRAVYYPGFKIIHHVGASGRGNPSVMAEKYRGVLLYWCKHHPVWEVFCVRVVMVVSLGLRYLFCRDVDFRNAYRRIVRYAFSSSDYVRGNKVLGG